jgi:hypothetical protein
MVVSIGQGPGLDVLLAKRLGFLLGAFDSLVMLV